jgi:hypothetical protein
VDTPDTVWCGVALVDAAVPRAVDLDTTARLPSCKTLLCDPAVMRSEGWLAMAATHPNTVIHLSSMAGDRYPTTQVPCTDDDEDDGPSP